MRFSWQPQPQVRAVGFVADLAARQVRRQRGALGLLLVGRVLGGRRALLDLQRQSGEVGVQRLFDQALLLGVEGFALGGELQALEHGHLVRELVDGGLLEGDLVALASHVDHQGAHDLAQLLRAEGFDLCAVDHEA